MCFCFCKQKTAYEVRISDWSSDVCSSDLGKTRVITCRIANLIHQGVRPHQILAITFTNKAAAEIKQRVAAMMPDQRIWISTFHSLGVRLLRQRSAERRVGNEGVSSCRSGWWPYH